MTEIKFKGFENLKKENPRKKKTKPAKPNANLGWLFYKNYFNSLTNQEYLEISKSNRNQFVIREIEQKIEKKVEKVLSKKVNSNYKLPFEYQKFTLTTIYPGLILGSGYLHELKDIKGQAILGFDFDYTTGEVVIRGSSIKGILRHAFEHKEYIEEILGKEISNYEEFKNSIFDNSDVFLDAVVINFTNNLLEDDYITPHLDITKNPIPLRFIKVAPDVTFEFRFILKDFENITKEEKLNIFKKIILDLGLGAKINVGFGKFKDSQ